MQPNWEIWLDTNISPIIAPKLINLKFGNCDNRTMWSLLQPKIMELIQLLTQSDVQIIDFEK